MSSRIVGNHHITLSWGRPGGLRLPHAGRSGCGSIKKTALYDGEVPIYHLYYGNAHGDGGTILTSFPMRQQGIRGHLGHQSDLAAEPLGADGSLGYWADRLRGLGFGRS